MYFFFNGCDMPGWWAEEERKSKCVKLPFSMCYSLMYKYFTSLHHGHPFRHVFCVLIYTTSFSIHTVQEYHTNETRCYPDRVKPLYFVYNSQTLSVFPPQTFTYSLLLLHTPLSSQCLPKLTPRSNQNYTKIHTILAISPHLTIFFLLSRS